MIGRKNLADHIIICGVNDTSLNIISALETYTFRLERQSGDKTPTAKPYIVIDQDEQILKSLKKKCDHFHGLVGDATDDDVLQAAGIREAFGIFPVLEQNKDNIFITFTARRMNSSIRIVARTTDIFNIDRKLRTAGADAVVSPNFIGGMRLASELIRPESVALLDQYLRQKDNNTQFGQLSIPGNFQQAGSAETAKPAITGDKISTATGVQIIALKRLGSDSYIYNPPVDAELYSGDQIVVLSDANQMTQIKELLAGKA